MGMEVPTAGVIKGTFFVTPTTVRIRGTYLDCRRPVFITLIITTVIQH